MPPWIIGAIIACVVTLVISGIIFAILHEKKRTERIRMLAQEMGFSYEHKAELTSLGGTPEFKLFSKGYAQHIMNLLSGQAQDTIARIFDYQYTTRSGNNSSTTWRQTVMMPVAFQW